MGLAIVYTNMQYVMYLVDKELLGKRKRTFWGTHDQDILESLMLHNPHIAPKDLVEQYLEQNTCALQDSKGIIENFTT